jgi:transcriptional regulator with XRE-family HTH domain
MAADDYEYKQTRAAQMLSEGLRRASAERGLSVRQLGKKLNYKQAVVLSHWATGRVPIPIDRAVEVAREVGLPEREFLLAVLEQRHAEVDWKLITGFNDDLIEDLEDIAGKPLATLSPEHQQVMKEVVAEVRPARRWLTVNEVPVMEAIREQLPFVRSDGMPRSMIELLTGALQRR